MHHCLTCGYNRTGLEPDALCPECGEADRFRERQNACEAFIARPGRVILRFMTLRKPPPGWWEVFDDSSRRPPRRRIAWLAVLAATLGLMCLFIFSQFVQMRIEIEDAWYAPDATLVATREQSMMIMGLPMGGGVSFSGSKPAGGPYRHGRHVSRAFEFDLDLPFGVHGAMFNTFFAFYGFLLWLAFRFVWLRLTRARRLDEEERRAVARAADANAQIFIAHVLLILLISVVSLALIYTCARWAMTIQPIASVVIVLLLLFFPTVQWSRTLLADRSRRIFPRRYVAMALLLVLSITAYICMTLAFVGVAYVIDPQFL